MVRRRAQGQAGGRLPLAWGAARLPLAWGAARLPLAWGAATSRLAGVRDWRGPRRPRPVVLRLGGHVHSGPWWSPCGSLTWTCPLALIDHPTSRTIRKPTNRFATVFSMAAVTIILHR